MEMGRRTCAYDYAKKLCEAYKGDNEGLLEKLAAYDEAVAVQVAAILQEQGVVLDSGAFAKSLEKAGHRTRAGFSGFIRALRLTKNSNRAVPVKNF